MKNGKFTESNGTQKWYKDNLLHRTDGPGIIYPTGNQEWYQNGKLHRLDGPALIWTDDNIVINKRWYINGVYISATESEFKDFMIHYNLKSIVCEMD